MLPASAVAGGSDRNCDSSFRGREVIMCGDELPVGGVCEYSEKSSSEATL